jgi:hypothetical protein
VSESTENKPEQPTTPGRGGGRGQQRSQSNPLSGSALFSDTPAAPPLPDLTTGAGPIQSSTTARWGEQITPLLYNSPAPPEYTLRPFEQRHDRQTIYIDARKAGALDALVKLVKKGNKTDLVEEMVNDILEKHAQVLQENTELVRLLEERYRKKHNL